MNIVFDCPAANVIIRMDEQRPGDRATPSTSASAVVAEETPPQVAPRPILAPARVQVGEDKHKIYNRLDVLLIFCLLGALATNAFPLNAPCSESSNQMRALTESAVGVALLGVISKIIFYNE